MTGHLQCHGARCRTGWVCASVTAPLQAGPVGMPHATGVVRAADMWSGYRVATGAPLLRGPTPPDTPGVMYAQGM
jgi:hypothetical protein